MNNNICNNKYVYAFVNVHNSVSIVNYDAENIEVNLFLEKFDVWKSKGLFKLSEDTHFQEVWFECRKDIWEMLHNPIFKTAFELMGVKLTFDYPYV